MVDSQTNLISCNSNCCRAVFAAFARFLDGKRHPPPALTHVIVLESEVRSLLHFDFNHDRIKCTLIFFHEELCSCLIQPCSDAAFADGLNRHFVRKQQSKTHVTKQ